MKYIGVIIVIFLYILKPVHAVMEREKMDDNIEPQIELISNLNAPISQGQVVGTVTYTIDGTDYSSDLIASHNVVPQNNYITITGIVLLLLVLIVLIKLLFPKKHKDNLV